MVCIAVASGYLAGAHAVEVAGEGVYGHAAWVSGVTLASLVGGAVVGVWARAWPARRPRLRTALVLGCWGALAWVRGAATWNVDDVSVALDGGERGATDGLRELLVTGAGMPGPRCVVLARPLDRRALVLLRVPASACPLVAGQRVRVPVRELVPVSGPAVPGDSDPAAFARAAGASFAADIEHLWPAGGRPSAYWGAVAQLRHRAWKESRGDDALGFVAAGTLGVRAALSPLRRQHLREAGMGHLVAVSGVHVGIAAWLVHLAIVRVAGGLGASPAMGVVMSWLPILAYVGLTGAAPPAVRAGVMLMLIGLAVIMGRPAHGLVVLAVAAASMLLHRPAWTVDPGFQLSLAAMAVLVRSPGGTGWVTTSWRVAWAIAPLSLVHFGNVSAVGIVANVVAIPLFGVWVLPLGLAGWLLAPWLGGSALAPARWGAQVLLDWAEVLARLPPPSDTWLVVSAAVALLAHVLWPRPPSSPRWWYGWIPPFLASAGLLVALAVSRLGAVEPAPEGTWFALGGPRSVARIRMEAHGNACVADPRGAPARWPRIVASLGIRHVRLAGAQAPHVRAVARSIERSGHDATLGSRCVTPSEPHARAVLHRCNVPRTAPCQFARVDGEHGPIHCFCGGLWETLPPLKWDAP